jgi:hypothetical protein
MNLSGLDSKCTDVAIAVEPLEDYLRPRFYLLPKYGRKWGTDGIVLNERNKLRIGHHAIECAINLRWDYTLNLQILHLALKTTWLHKS